MSILGTRVVRTEDPVFLTRGATYTDDLIDERLTGALHLRLVRSPLAHATITSIDTSAALDSPGVVAVITGADLDIEPALLFPGANKAMTRPFLATDRVRFVGEPVAAVLTEDFYQGEDAAELVDVEYEPLDAVIDPLAAVQDEILLFPEAGTNTAAAYGYDSEPDPDYFAGCEVVVTRDLMNQRLAAAPLETRAASAFWDGDRCTLYMSNQNAQGGRDEVAGWLGMDKENLRVILPDVGGGFGAEIGSDPEFAIVAWLARRQGRPVRWNESRSENMTGMVQGRAQRQTITIGGTRAGKVTHYRLDVVQDLGAYPRLGTFLSVFTRMMAPGTYDIENVDLRARAVVTNTTSIAAYRGAGRPEATAAIERAMDLFAAEIGKDPAEVRKLNVVAPDRFPFQTKGGVEYDSGEYAKAIDLALEKSGYDRLRAEQKARRERGDARQLGIGVSSYVEITGGGAFAEDASVEVHPDGAVTVLTGTSPHGQGHATAWAMLASDQLGVPIEKITVKHGDTDLVPRGGGTMGSRSLQTGGVAVHQASAELIDLAKQRAADLLEASVDDLELDPANAAITVRGVPSAKSVTLAELAAAEQLKVDTTWDGEKPTFPFGAHVCVVEVDTESGKVTVEKIVAVDDAGPILNPLLCEGQRHGGIAQALLEEVVFDEEGQPLTGTFADYGIPSAAELPSFDLVEMTTPTPVNPMGYKGIGEAGTIGSTPATQSAVIDALSHLGVTHIDMPLTPLRVWEAVHSASEGSK
ncbi:Carbon monoxide dehydrogenase large chain [Pseudonocardia sp. Ae168_Ps1]|uniref:xanthine dehydrogenase family protein molybdopterin-binding subunit n=1 Tax=unclassified Pseudonocardia TaxID=2619320 RepID=UPI00094ACEFF|nr:MULTISPECIES: xanthine dehydrogenase family protein molybdopterin-binding subunit [unclassified Pseudonocardia]OLL74530.1 Carbon monoxide dehydrogenase large chain [Pseudonocardia sp. Ae150A_Ps1]OLL80510.1 Carbon monoxide dehydrogenase large chain [Pseudonocardia sp. Ae168_Ps1]OLL85362.1 Carbon monoxide dehydrogenase large chain [Pseudonocardia sp. Ae263_Ps1]OLL94611.1 Carbon monoxide dehydrogenase large chain [Pseudonocardia sp. Ae356_Ps1]